MRLWACPNAVQGRSECPAVRAPKRPHKDDVRRFCLACSAKGDRLVRRVVPAVKAERNRARAAKLQRPDREPLDVRKLTPGMLLALHSYFRYPGDSGERFGRGPDVTKRTRIALHGRGFITHARMPGYHERDAELTPRGQAVLRMIDAAFPDLATKAQEHELVKLAELAKERPGDAALLKAFGPVFKRNGGELLAGNGAAPAPARST